MKQQKGKNVLSSMSLALCGQYEFMPKLLPKSSTLNYFETLSTHYTGVINKPIVKRFCSSIWYSIYHARYIVHNRTLDWVHT